MIVASSIDESTMRIVSYLSEYHGVGINYATFQYFKQTDEELLARVFLIEPGQVERRSESGRTSKREPNLRLDDSEKWLWAMGSCTSTTHW